MKRLIFPLLVISVSFCFAQKTFTSSTDVFKEKELTFYGYDFSGLKLAETKRMGEDMSQQIFGWISFCQEKFNEEKMKDIFKKDRVNFNWGPIVEQAKKINGKEVVTYTKHSIPKDSVQNYVNRLSLSEKDGIGLVVVLECFEKNTKMTSAYFTFFDISSKKILLCDYYAGRESDGYGLINYWGIGINGTTGNYASTYRKRLKEMGLR